MDNSCSFYKKTDRTRQPFIQMVDDRSVMETTLHHQLKEKFREPGSEIEVKIGRYRIDVVNGERLVEIQRSGLAAIRDKINILLQDFEVDVVKPLIVRKRLVKLDRKDGSIVEERWSPRRGTILDVFDELLYFTRVFPHPNLRLIAPLIEIEEHRYPGHGKRRRRRKGDFEVKDRFLSKMHDIEMFETAADLHRLMPENLPSPFDSANLAEGLGVQRWIAQRIAYVLRHTGSAELVGKKGNTNLFKLVSNRPAKGGKKKKVQSRKSTASKANPDNLATPKKRSARRKKTVA